MVDPRQASENVGRVSAKATGIWTCALRDLAGFFSRIDGAEVMLRGNAVIGITGGPTADFNMALFGDDPDEVSVFEEFLSRVKAAGVSAIAVMSGVSSRRLSSVAEAKGLTEAGAAPLMVWSGTLPEAPSSEFVTRRINAPGEVSVFGELVAAAFGLDRPWIDRTFAATSLLAAPGLAIYVAHRGNVPMSGVCTTSAGATCGIWTMSTPPDKQRQGAGRAVLLAAMQEELNRGVDTFYLIATAAGKPLYDRLGFQTVEELSIWLAGESSQFPGH